MEDGGSGRENVGERSAEGKRAEDEPLGSVAGSGSGRNLLPPGLGPAMACPFDVAGASVKKASSLLGDLTKWPFPALVGVRELSLPTSSQPVLSSGSRLFISKSESEGFLLAPGRRSGRGEDVGGMFGVDGAEDWDPFCVLATSHFFTPSRFIGNRSDPPPLDIVGVVCTLK